KWTGKTPEDVFEAEENGLRINLPPTRQKRDPVGLELRLPLAGNFEVTLGYEILEVHRSRNPYGDGVELYLMTQTSTKEAIAFAHGLRPNGKPTYLCRCMTDGKDGKRIPKAEPRDIPAGAATGVGQLRVSRRGDEVTLWVADGAGGEFR